MASNFRGLADDWSAMFFNPGGLTQLTGKWTFGASAGVIMPRGEFTQAAYPVLPFSGMYTDEREATAHNFFVPALGIFYKPSESLVIGLGVYAPFGLGAEWDLMTIPSSYGNATGFSQENEHDSDHMVINIQPTVAFKLSDKISIGVGLSYIWGQMDLDMVKLGFNPTLEEVEIAPGMSMSRWAALQAGLAQMGVALPALTADQHRIPVENILSGDGSAYGINFGLHFNLSEKFSIGLSGRYSTDLKMTGTFTQNYIMSGDPTKAGILTAVPDIVFADASDPTGTANKMQILSLFSGQSIPNIDNADVEADLPLPMNLGGGIAFKPSPKLTLTADVSWTNWASWDEIVVRVDGGDDLTLKENWANTIEMGAGFEWMAKESDASQIFLRGGFYTVDTPVPDESLNPTLLDPNRRYIVTGGLGLNLGKVSFNLAGEYVLFGDKELPASGYEFDTATGTSENYAGLYSFRAMVITFGTSISL